MVPNSDILLKNIVTSLLYDIVFTKIKLSDVRSYVFPLISDIYSRVCDTQEQVKIILVEQTAFPLNTG